MKLRTRIMETQTKDQFVDNHPDILALQKERTDLFAVIDELKQKKHAKRWRLRYALQISELIAGKQYDCDSGSKEFDSYLETVTGEDSNEWYEKHEGMQEFMEEIVDGLSQDITELGVLQKGVENTSLPKTWELRTTRIAQLEIEYSQLGQAHIEEVIEETVEVQQEIAEEKAEVEA